VRQGTLLPEEYQPGRARFILRAYRRSTFALAFASFGYSLAPLVPSIFRRSGKSRSSNARARSPGRRLRDRESLPPPSGRDRPEDCRCTWRPTPGPASIPPGPVLWELNRVRRHGLDPGLFPEFSISSDFAPACVFWGLRRMRSILFGDDCRTWTREASRYESSSSYSCR
jgi:hypothetical protein